ncbi:MAG: hypothetical protein JWP10_1579 [Nocardioidaceae bacterium]|nr:hypothetical protein [Nocardioidaceae bacterium]
MRVSVLDLGNVAPGTTETEGLADALDTARAADAMGFHRIWFAEHHLSRGNASHHPELLIAAAMMQTTGIRLGSGAVLMNHYSPFKVAEMFQQLEAMAPGRIDLGIGRAPGGGPIVDLAMRRDRQSPHRDDYTQQVLEVLAWLHGAFPDEHAFAGTPLMTSVATVPQTWMLGSSPSGGALAASLGMGYTFAGFINPDHAVTALQSYRSQFQPQPFGLQEPRAILGVNVTVADTTAEARRRVSSGFGLYARAAIDPTNATIPSIDEAARELSQAALDEPTTIVGGRWPRFVAGNPAEVRATLDEMLEASGADELIVQEMIADPKDRRHTHELIAEMFDLTPRA